MLVDYQFFDLVVRNVIPTDPNQMSNQLPDNGVMMVNPRDITVVFSPQLTVQGRPINAQVVFEKFTHRMTPIRMRISLEMRVMYFGPMLTSPSTACSRPRPPPRCRCPSSGGVQLLLHLPGMVGEASVRWYLSTIGAMSGGSNKQVTRRARRYASSRLPHWLLRPRTSPVGRTFPSAATARARCGRATTSGSDAEGLRPCQQVEGMMDYFTSSNWKSTVHICSVALRSSARPEVVPPAR